MIRKASSLLVLALLMPAVHASESIEHSFLNGQFDSSALRVLGQSEYLTRENRGLRITIPRSSREGDNAGIALPLQLIGDFLLSARVEILAVPKPKDGYGTGITILIEDGISNGASFQRVVSTQGDDLYISHQFDATGGEYEHKSTSSNAASKETVLQLERIGNELIYRVSENDAATFEEINRVPFSLDPIQTVQIYGQPGGTGNQLSVRLKQMTVQADKFLRRGQTIPTRSMLPGWAVATMLVTGLSGACLGLWWLRRIGETR